MTATSNGTEMRNDADTRRGTLAARAAGFLSRRVDRRGVLRRGAMAGTALAVAPTDFLLRPMTAYAAVCGSGALCNDGYTEFCCSTHGSNRCPPGTMLGGWWKVDGHEFCGGGPRYYMDCNAGCGGCGCGGNGICSGSCSGTGCGCAHGDCNNRKSGCTGFRYGQCNQNVRCLGPIVCRVVTCTQPWMLDGTCSTSVRTDNRTRYHNRPCLAVDAVGATESIKVVAGGVRVTGWALDPTTAAPVAVVVYSCLRPITILRADRSRSDVGAAFAGVGDNHGFDAFLRLCPGEQLISIAAVDTSGQGSTWIAHQMVNIGGEAFGHFDSATGTAPKPGSTSGHINVRGFAIDVDAFAPTQVEIRLDGRLVRTVTANLTRSDVAQAYPHLGGDSGFDETIAATPGVHDVCITALNKNLGSNRDLGCRTVTVPANPEGSLDSVVSPGPGSLRVLGWALDPDARSAISVKITVDGRDAGSHPANRPRDDGHSGRGFDVTLTNLEPGSRTVCVTAVNVGGGANVKLGCMTAAVAADTVGMVEQLAAAPGGVELRTTSIKRTDGETNAVLRVLVDGGYRASIRPGDNGTVQFVSVDPGLHEVQVVATLDGPRTVPILLASAQLDIPGQGLP